MNETIYEVCRILGCKHMKVNLTNAGMATSDLIGVAYAYVIQDEELVKICKEKRSKEFEEDLFIGISGCKKYYPEALWVYAKIHRLECTTDLLSQKDKDRGDIIYSEIVRRIKR